MRSAAVFSLIVSMLAACGYDRSGGVAYPFGEPTIVRQQHSVHQPLNTAPRNMHLASPTRHTRTRGT